MADDCVPREVTGRRRAYLIGGGAGRLVRPWMEGVNTRASFARPWQLVIVSHELSIRHPFWDARGAGQVFAVGRLLVDRCSV